MRLSEEVQADVEEWEEGGLGSVYFEAADQFEFLKGLDQKRPARLYVGEGAANVVCKGPYS